MSDIPSFPLPARSLLRRDGRLYRQVAEHLRAAIADEAIAIGAPLPTEAHLAQHFGVSLITVRQALRDLAQDGLVRKRAAKPAVVAARTPPRQPSVRLTSLADIVANTAHARLDIVGWKPERSRLAESVFGLPRNTGCHCLRGRVLAEAGPVAVVAIYFPPRVGSLLARADFDDVVVFRSVQRRLGLVYTGGRVTVQAALATPRVARALECQVGAAVLVNEFVYFGPDGAPVELTVAQHRADRHRLTYDLRVD
jgi:GntR family transcriptional regulator